jgi:hypothetical protein
LLGETPGLGGPGPPKARGSSAPAWQASKNYGVGVTVRDGAGEVWAEMSTFRQYLTIEILFFSKKFFQICFPNVYGDTSFVE